jgi:hypothetical protein
LRHELVREMREGPSEPPLQGEALNRLKLLWAKAMVVSVEEKAHKMRQV